jgi:hypothetical protein
MQYVAPSSPSSDPGRSCPTREREISDECSSLRAGQRDDRVAVARYKRIAAAFTVCEFQKL